MVWSPLLLDHISCGEVEQVNFFQTLLFHSGPKVNQIHGQAFVFYVISIIVFHSVDLFNGMVISGAGMVCNNKVELCTITLIFAFLFVDNFLELSFLN